MRPLAAIAARFVARFRDRLATRLAALPVALAAALALPAAAQETEVDVELVLLVDVSRSMTPHELEIQRLGYAAAIGSDEVQAAVEAGLLGRVAIAYVEWAGTQRVVLDWRLLQSRADLDAFSLALASSVEGGLRRTSISEALVFARGMIETNRFRGLRRVIDVSGDGPNNQGRPVEIARDDAVAAGIVINGLPLMTQKGTGGRFTLPDLDVYYRACVAGGPGSFVLPVHDWMDFAKAVKRKLVLEIAAVPEAPSGRAVVVPVQYRPGPDYDCLIGEKIWRDRQDFDFLR